MTNGRGSEAAARRAREPEDADLDAPAPDLARLIARLRGPLGWVAVATLGIFLLGLLAVLRVGKTVALPVTLAVLLNFVLSPISSGSWGGPTSLRRRPGRSGGWPTWKPRRRRRGKSP